MSLPSEPETPRRGDLKQSANQASPRRVRGIRPLTWILLLAIIGPCAIQMVPHEIGRWHLAVAIRLREKGDKDTAYQELAEAMRRFPSSPELLLRRAEWKLEDGQSDEALADGRRAVDLAGDNADVFLARARLSLKARKFALAVEDLEKVESFSRRSGKPPLHEALNELAYARALAKIELNAALRSANEALEILPAESQSPGTKDYYPKRIILDTRGYIHFLLGEYMLALDDLNEAVAQSDEALRRRRDTSKGDHSEVPSMSGSAAEKARAAEVAVIHYHRSLVLAALDRKDEAEKDLKIVRQLIGREPDETLF